MATKEVKAIMGVDKPTDYKKVTEVGEASVTAMTANSVTFNNPDPPLATITAQINLTRSYASQVKDGDHSKIALRDSSSKLLYRMLQQQLIYVNQIGNGDKSILSLSGFTISDDPNPQPIPDKVVIKRVINDKASKSAKIFIESLRLGRLIYYVEMTLTIDNEASWKNVLTTKNSRKLIIPNMVFGQIVYFRVCASNSSGIGSWSEPFTFVSQK
ncbi:MAG: fibronectin type III domain-containing protein [Bacteroidales bacterium]|nr:fibronectin type III domain-containing protein [Bacteroidales bacterium]